MKKLPSAIHSQVKVGEPLIFPSIYHLNALVNARSGVLQKSGYFSMLLVSENTSGFYPGETIVIPGHKKTTFSILNRTPTTITVNPKGRIGKFSAAML